MENRNGLQRLLTASAVLLTLAFAICGVGFAAQEAVHYAYLPPFLGFHPLGSISPDTRPPVSSPPASSPSPLAQAAATPGFQLPANLGVQDPKTLFVTTGPGFSKEGDSVTFTTPPTDKSRPARVIRVDNYAGGPMTYSLPSFLSIKVKEIYFADGSTTTIKRIVHDGPIKEAKLAAPPHLDLAALQQQPLLQNPSTRETLARALRIYDSQNSPSSPGFEDGRRAVTLFTFFATAGDPHGEGWYQIAAGYAAQAIEAGNRDPFVLGLKAGFLFERYDAGNDYLEKESANEVIALAATAYPAVLKAPILASTWHDFGPKYKRPDFVYPGTEYIPWLQEISLGVLDNMLTEGVDVDSIRTYCTNLLNLTSFQEGRREAHEKQVAALLARHNASPQIEDFLRVKFLIDWAWEARGDDVANNVTETGWKDMRLRLREAEEILQADRTTYPRDSGLLNLMLTVDVGLNLGDARTEEDFQRVIALDPDMSGPYYTKMWYLQPKWGGSPKEMFKFGFECLHGARWEAGIPLVLPSGMDDLAQEYPGIYAIDAVLSAVDSTYREYLRRFPTSIEVRTRYLRFADSLCDKATVQAQLKALHGYWDLSILRQNDFYRIQQEYGQAQN